ncbi:Phox-like protein [Athelia psychrophila]|uniref:Endosomal/vacuolar adapter protein YPT35 n=1 Tax=Athelia psychrophila TaxID=1759441 RepID=A0A166PHH0_9AGAM|nr:Phox-like protein [Fibularhizoctonia sp. CBS 109695]
MASTSTSPPAPIPAHPFANSKSLLVVIPDDKIDVEEEARLYDELCVAQDDEVTPTLRRPSSPAPLSIFSKDIWLGDNSGESLAFARDVRISGWTSVGDKLGGAYIVYDCVIKTKEGTTIHAHKRYSAFDDLRCSLEHYLPHHQRASIPPLPPKSPLARFRPPFLEERRRRLQYWLASVLLHPEIGGCKPVRLWVMD